MIARYRDGVVPQAAPPAELVAAFDGLAESVAGRIDRIDLSAALDEIWQRVRGLNRFVADEAPWQLAKDRRAGRAAGRVLYGLAEGLRVVAVLLPRGCPTPRSAC